MDHDDLWAYFDTRPFVKATKLMVTTDAACRVAAMGSVTGTFLTVIFDLCDWSLYWQHVADPQMWYALDVLWWLSMPLAAIAGFGTIADFEHSWLGFLLSKDILVIICQAIICGGTVAAFVYNVIAHTTFLLWLTHVFFLLYLASTALALCASVFRLCLAYRDLWTWRARPDSFENGDVQPPTIKVDEEPLLKAYRDQEGSRL